jgi:hypothetical protein
MAWCLIKHRDNFTTDGVTTEENCLHIHWHETVKYHQETDTDLKSLRTMLRNYVMKFCPNLYHTKSINIYWKWDKCLGKISL